MIYYCYKGDDPNRKEHNHYNSSELIKGKDNVKVNKINNIAGKDINDELKNLFNRKIVEITGDGNCMFYAIAHQLLLLNDSVKNQLNDEVKTMIHSETDHEKLGKNLRETIMTRLQEHKDNEEIKSKIELIILGHSAEYPNMNVDEWIEFMKTNRKWADYAVIAFITRFLNIPLYIIQQNFDDNPIIMFEHGIDNKLPKLDNQKVPPPSTVKISNEGVPPPSNIKISNPKVSSSTIKKSNNKDNMINELISELTPSTKNKQELITNIKMLENNITNIDNITKNKKGGNNVQGYLLTDLIIEKIIRECRVESGLKISNKNNTVEIQKPNNYIMDQLIEYDLYML